MGHKKMMQVARMEWINEGKPHSSVHDDSIFNEPAEPRADDEVREKTASRIAPIFEKTTAERPKTPEKDDLDDLFGDDDAIYDATPKATTRKEVQNSGPPNNSLFGGATASMFGPAKEVSTEEEFPEDDLDALLQEEAMMQDTNQSKNTSKPGPATDNFDDEMDAMQGMDW